MGYQEAICDGCRDYVIHGEIYCYGCMGRMHQEIKKLKDEIKRLKYLIDKLDAKEVE